MALLDRGIEEMGEKSTVARERAPAQINRLFSQWQIRHLVWMVDGLH